MIDKIIRLLYYILFFITPLVMYPATSEIFEFNKMLFIYLITASITFFWIVKMIVNRKIILKKTFLDIPIVLFLLSQIISTIFSIDRHTSLFGYYGRFNGGLMSVISYILLYYGFISNSLDFKKIIKLTLLSSLVVILWGLPGHFGRDLTCPVFNTVLSATSGQLNANTLKNFWTTGFNNSCWSRETNVFDPVSRLFSTLGQPNWLGAYLAINFFIGLYFLIKNKDDTKYLVLSTLYLFLNFSTILFTRSRSSLMAIGAGLILFLIYYLLSVKVDFKKIVLTLLFIIVVPAILFKTGIQRIDKFFQLPNNPPAGGSITNNQSLNVPSEITESLDIRKIVWKGAVDLGLRFPLTGSGVETFAYSYFLTRPAAHNETSEWDFLYNKAHNEYLNYFATAGFPGILTHMFFIGAFIFCSLKILNHKSKADRLLVLSLSIAWMTILITNFFGFSTTTINIFFYLIPALIYSSSFVEKQRVINKINLYQWAGILSSAGLLIYITISILNYFSADIDYGRGVYYSNPKINDYQKAAFYFDRALKKRQEHVYEDKLSYALAYLSGIASYQQNNDLANQLMQGAEFYNVKSLRSSPRNVLYWKTRAKNKYLFYLVKQDKNELTQGVETLNEAARLAPTDPKIPYSLSVFYSLLADLETESKAKVELQNKAMSAAKESIDLKSNFQDAFLLQDELIKKYNL